MVNNWIKLATTHHYDNPWISVTEDQVINPAGNKGIYGIVHFKNLAIGIIPMDQEGNIYMVGQYRYVRVVTALRFLKVAVCWGLIL